MAFKISPFVIKTDICLKGSAFVLNAFLLPQVELTQNSGEIQKGQIRESLNFIFSQWFPTTNFTLKCEQENISPSLHIFISYQHGAKLANPIPRIPLAASSPP